MENNQQNANISDGDGVTTHKCNNCGQSSKQQQTPPTPGCPAAGANNTHDWGTAFTTYSCSNAGCGLEWTNNTPTTGCQSSKAVKGNHVWA